MKVKIAIITVIFWAFTCAGPKKDLPFDPAEFRLPNTFSQESSLVSYQKWAPYTGAWSYRSLKTSIHLILTPRSSRKIEEPGSLSGFILDGKYEGAMIFRKHTSPASGKLFRADKNLSPLNVELEINPASKKRLKFSVYVGGDKKDYILKFNRKINNKHITNINVLAHKGIGFEKHGNTKKSFRHSWFFGASGIELDVVIPRGKRNRPLLNQMRVYHPVRLRATEKLDRIDKEGKYMSINDFFSRINQYGVSFFYIDPKVSWLDDGARRRALNRIISLSKKAMEQNPALLITIGSPNDETGAYLARKRWDLPGKRRKHSRKPTVGLAWIAEWYRCYFPLPRSFFSIPIDKGKTSDERVMTDLKMAISKSIGIRKRAPYIISLAYYHIPDNDGGMVDCLCPDIDSDEEKEMSKLPQAMIFWNIDTKKGLKTVLKAAKRMGRSIENPNNISIMSNYPHKLIYWLATMKK